MPSPVAVSELDGLALQATHAKVRAKIWSGGVDSAHDSGPGARVAKLWWDPAVALDSMTEWRHVGWSFGEVMEYGRSHENFTS